MFENNLVIHDYSGLLYQEENGQLELKRKPGQVEQKEGKEKLGRWSKK